MAAASAPELKLDPKYDNYDYPTVAPVAQNGHPGHTTPEQDAQVFQLRTQLEQEGYTKNLDTLTLVGTYVQDCQGRERRLICSSCDSSVHANSMSTWRSRCERRRQFITDNRR